MSDLLRPVIEAARQGDERARSALAGCVDRFVRLFSGSLSQQVRRTCGSTLDFVNEGLAEALSRLGEFEYRSDEEFYGWVSRLIKSRILDAVRRQESKKRGGRPVALEEGLDSPIASGSSPSQAAAASEVREAVKAAMLELQVTHPEEMEAVLLKVFEDLSWSDLKDWLELSSVKRGRLLCARGLDLLRPRIAAAVGRAAFEEYLGL